MIQDEQNQMGSNNSINSTSIVISGGNRSSSSSSKKLKHKKVPQRGLGVAQLEKIRIEEQQKKDGSNTTDFPSPSTTISTTHSSSLPAPPIPSYPLNKQSKSSNPFSPSSPSSNLPSPNLIFRSCPLPDMESFPMYPSNGTGNDVGWPSMSNHGNTGVSFPMLWQPYEFTHDKKGENSRLDDNGFSFQSNLSLPYESCPIGNGPLTDVMSRGQQYQQSSTLVNISQLNRSSSSVLNFPMEPPSSQSYSCSYSPLWPDDDRMTVGMKRPCPFPVDNLPIPTFHGKFATFSTNSMSRSDELTRCGIGGTTLNFDPAIPIFREVPSCSSALPEPLSRKNYRSENGSSSGEFLTLAPPAIFQPYPSSKLKQSATFLASHNRELFSFESLPYQGSIEDIVIDTRQGGPSEQHSLFNFFPATKVQVGSTSSSNRHNTCNGEPGSIDLNLRL